MSRTDLKKFDCSVAQTLDQIGEWWTMLILRNAFHGFKRFDDFQAQLEISPTVLSARLKALTKNGILEKRKSTDDGRASDYILTEKGLDLYPILISMLEWGEKYAPSSAGPRIKLIDKRNHKPIQSVSVLAHDGRKLGAKDVMVYADKGSDSRMEQLINYRGDHNGRKTAQEQ